MVIFIMRELREVSVAVFLFLLLVSQVLHHTCYQVRTIKGLLSER